MSTCRHEQTNRRGHEVQKSFSNVSHVTKGNPFTDWVTYEGDTNKYGKHRFLKNPV